MRAKRLILLGLVVLLGVLSFFILEARPKESALPTAAFGGVSLSIELATTTSAQERGLGGRALVPDNYGMLFVFPRSAAYGFWMKDMRVPIDMYWLDDKGQVITIVTNVSPESYPNVFYPTGSARYVLETRSGFARDYAIATGTMLDLKNLGLVSN